MTPPHHANLFWCQIYLYLSFGAPSHYSVTTAIKGGHNIQLWLRRGGVKRLFSPVIKSEAVVLWLHLSISGEGCVLVLSDLSPHHDGSVLHRAHQKHISEWQEDGTVRRTTFSPGLRLTCTYILCNVYFIFHMMGRHSRQTDWHASMCARIYMYKHTLYNQLSGMTDDTRQCLTCSLGGTVPGGRGRESGT